MNSEEPEYRNAENKILNLLGKGWGNKNLFREMILNAVTK